MVKNLARPDQVPPQIAHNPNRVTFDPHPIVKTEQYAARMRDMELTQLMMDQQNYYQGVWKAKDMKRKERCPACHGMLSFYCPLSTE